VNDNLEKSLAQRAVRGSMWMFGCKLVHRGLGLLRTFIMARILSPDDLGLFGIALLAFNLVENFSVTGVSSVLVQKKEDIRGYLDSAWMINVFRALLLFGLLYFGATPIAIFFGRSEVKELIKAIAFIQLFLGAENICSVYFQKEMLFNKLFYLKVSSILTNLIVSVTLALTLKSVWALVYGTLAGALVKSIVSYLLHPYRPKLSFNVAKIKELLAVGKWFFGSSILVFLITEGDDAVVGKLLGAAALGLYQMAYLLSSLPATEISNFVATVTFPAYSKLQGDIARLRSAYFKVLQLVTFLCFPISGLIFLLAPDFTQLLLGEKWMSMVPALQILTLWGLIRCVEAATIQIFYATGKPSMATKILFVELLLIVILIYPLTAKWGIVGTSWTIVAAAVIPNLSALGLGLKILRGRICDLGKILLLPIVNTFLMIAVIHLLKSYWPGNIMLIFSILIGLIVYLSAAEFFKLFLNYDIWYVLRVARKEMSSEII
jgi:O-antigen/teichoic acid export membrane protein